MKTRKRLSLLLFAFAAVLVSGCTGPRVLIGTKDEVRYKGTATEQEAKALGEALKAEGVFTDRGVTVVLSKGSDATVISFVVKEGLWDDFTYVSGLEQVTRAVAPSVGGLPVKLRLVTAELDTKKELVVHAPMMFGSKDTVAYSDAATMEEAKALGQALQSAGYFQDRGANVLLSKGKDGTTISFVVKDGIWDDESNVAGFQTMVRGIAPAVGGLPIKVRLVNTTLEKKKEFPVT
jgi:hypothetical protein